MIQYLSYLRGFLKNLRWLIRITGIILIVVAILISFKQYQKAQRQMCFFSDGIQIAGVPVDGLDIRSAQTRVEAVYQSPIELKINGSAINLYPEEMGIFIDYEKMINEAASNCYQLTNWQKFWNYLWNRSVSGDKSVGLIISIDDERIQDFIDSQIVPRYTFQALPAYSISGNTEFQLGSPGISFNEDKLVDDLKIASSSTTERVVIAKIEEINNSSPDLSMIESKLTEIINSSEFNGLVAINIEKLSTGETINFATQNNNDVDPNIAFTAASTMKIPIMLSTYWREDLPLPDIINGWINYMIVLSENAPADRLMENIDAIRGPLIVTEDMQLLGLKNTFIAGYFYFGSPLLNLFETPANSRTDINLDPDMYNQTTPLEIGSLLSSIYHCATSGTGLIVENTGGSITQEECKAMIETLSRNQIGALIESGVPEGTKVAHKHGWSEEQDGLLHTVSDVAIVFGPENDFVLTIFVYSPNQLLFDDANFLIAKLAQSTFNGLNPNHQIPWLFDVPTP
jgi:hypothetical protein